MRCSCLVWGFVTLFMPVLELLAGGAFVRGQDLSGVWLGVTYPGDPEAEIYNYTTNLFVTGTTISGMAQTANPDASFSGDVYVKGQFANQTLTYKESDSKGSQNVPQVCFWDTKLTYNPATESLKGTYTYIYNLPYCSAKGGGKMELYRIRLKSGSTYCPNKQANLEVTGIDIRWYDSAKKTKLLAKGNLYSATFPQSTTLYVTQTVYKSESPAIPIVIQVNTPRIDQVMVTPATCGESDGTLSVRASGSNGLQYALQSRTVGPVSGSTVSQSFPINPTYGSATVFTGRPSGSYTALVRDEAGCQTEYGADIPSGCRETVYLPSAFSPNGDGENEKLTLYHSLASVTVKRFQVFNRWGGVVFGRDDFPAQSGDALWDGLNLPFLSRFDVYPYLLEVQFASGETQTYRNTITLVR
jgi:hypothetical protein